MVFPDKPNLIPNHKIYLCTLDIQLGNGCGSSFFFLRVVRNTRSILFFYLIEYAIVDVQSQRMFVYHQQHFYDVTWDVCASLDTAYSLHGKLQSAKFNFLLSLRQAAKFKLLFPLIFNVEVG
jgi:hypothetical protein